MSSQNNKENKNTLIMFLYSNNIISDTQQGFGKKSTILIDSLNFFNVLPENVDTNIIDYTIDLHSKCQWHWNTRTAS